MADNNSELQPELWGIHNLLGRYGLLLDRLDVEEWLDLFTEDGVLDVDGRALDSREKRRRLAVSAPRGLHVSNPPVLSGERGSGELSSSSTFLFWGVDQGTTRIGWYEDRLVHDGTDWRFSIRRISFLDR